MTLHAPFPYFGGKRKVVDEVWKRFGEPKQYIEPFCGSAAILLGAPKAASLEVICDASGFIANFWRAVKHQPEEVARAADYPVSHIDLGARHAWLMQQRERLSAELHDPDWPGDAKVAGWWLWGQCCWIGAGWCDWDKAMGKIPHVSDPGRGVQAVGGIPHVSDAGRGVQGISRVVSSDDEPPAELLTSSGRVAWQWLRRLSDRLERVRVVHGDWHRCLNHHYGKRDTAVFLDPPYDGFESLYGKTAPTAATVSEWAREHEDMRVAICGHLGDYDLPGWEVFGWSRGKLTYGSSKTTEQEAIWFSPGCLSPRSEARECEGAAQIGVLL